MLANSLRARSVSFAYLFGPPRFVQRAEASSVFDAVSERLGVDDFQLQYSPMMDPDGPPKTRRFSIALSRKEGRGGIRVTVDHPPQPQALRLSIEDSWPTTMEHVRERFDMIAEAVFGALQGPDGAAWQKVLAETTIRAQCESKGGDSLAHMRARFLGLDDSWIRSLGERVSFASIALEVPAGPPAGDSLAHPLRRFRIEVLRESPSGFYLELMSQWPQVIPPPRSGVSEIDQSALRTFDQLLHAYVDDAYDWLRERVEVLGAQE